MQEYIAKAAVLIEALPYMQDFRGVVVVVKFGGSAMEVPECFESTMRDIVFMECVGMKPVIIHGGGKEISAELERLGIATRFIKGLRYTCDSTITVVDEILHGEVNPRLVNAVVKYGGEAVALSGKKILTAQQIKSKNPKTGDCGDLGYVGDVTSVDVAAINAILELNKVPVITPVGRGEDGQLYNINADIVASRVAAELKSRKLVFLSDVPGILKDPDDENSLLSTVSVSEVDGLIDSNVITGGMVPKIRSAIEALAAGTNKVHFIDGRMQHSLLLEIFTDEGVGTQIVKN